MTLNAPIEPITATDDELRAVLAEARIHPLLPALAMVTGDRSLVPAHLRPDVTNPYDPNFGLTDEAVAEAQELAFHALVAFRDGGSKPAPPPTDDDVLALMEFLVSDTETVERYRTFFAEELDVTGTDPRAPGWSKATVAPDRPFRVAIIGAGMSGLAAAHRLKQAGVDHVIFDKNDDVGGTWLENTYPGCRVDVPSHLYSYSFAQRDDWPQLFSKQEELLAYFRTVADELDLRGAIRFRTEVRRATFDEATAQWHVELEGPDGSTTEEFDAVISAVGQLNRPQMPAIAGIDRFTGPWFHSSHWDHTIDLTGKRVAVIGTGASAAQLVPEIAEVVDQLLVFQRTPNWIGPSDDYHSDTPDGMRWLFHHVPGYSHWYRLWLFWIMTEGLLPAVRVDPEWEGDGGSVSMFNELLRQMLALYIKEQLPDDPDLCAKVTPTYAPASKRIVRDSGKWLEALKRPNVELHVDAIDEITEKGVRAGGVDHDVDVIIYATGFKASSFLTPMQVVGRGGVDLHTMWDGDARAYLGITVPHFPNLFILYGPNTNIVVNGSIIFFSECEVDYVVDCVRLLLAEGHRALDCRPEVHDAYNARIDEGNRGMAWGVATVNSWYRNTKGRVAQNWPFSLLEYWQQTRKVEPSDYELL